MKRVTAVEEDAALPEQEVEGEAPLPSEQPAVTVPVSPSDILTMFFQVAVCFANKKLKYPLVKVSSSLHDS